MSSKDFSHLAALLLISAISLPAEARSSRTKKAKRSSSSVAAESPSEEKKSNDEVRKNSRYYRSKSSMYFAAEPIGLTFTPVFGGRAGMFLSEKFVGEVGLVTSTNVISKSNSKILVEGKAKWFVTNSLYVDAGLAIENWSLSEPSGTLTNIGAVTHLGNQWQWSSFTLGCDWVGYFLSLSTSSSYNEEVSGEELTRELDTAIYGGSSIHAVRFYLGFAI